MTYIQFMHNIAATRTPLRREAHGWEAKVLGATPPLAWLRLRSGFPHRGPKQYMYSRGPGTMSYRNGRTATGLGNNVMAFKKVSGPGKLGF